MGECLHEGVSFDLLVVRPADLAEFGLLPPIGAADVETLWAAELFAQGAESPSIAAFAAEIDRRHPMSDDEAFLSVQVSPPQPRAASVALLWSAAATGMREVLEVAFERGLAVLDPQNLLVFDPTDSEWMSVTTELGLPELPFVSPGILDQLLPRVTARQSHLVVNADDESEFYVQTRWRDGAFDLEHRAGDEHHHYEARTDDARVVRDVLWSWIVDDDAWQTAVEWRRLVF